MSLKPDPPVCRQKEAKILTVIGLTIMYAVCYVVPNFYISKNDFMNLTAKIIASIFFFLKLYTKLR